MLCAKSYKIKRNWPTAAAAATAAVSRSTAGGRRAASPVIVRSTPSLACYRKPAAAAAAAKVGLPWISTSSGQALRLYAYINVNVRSAAGPAEFHTGSYIVLADCPWSGQSASISKASSLFDIPVTDISHMQFIHYARCILRLKVLNPYHFSVHPPICLCRDWHLYRRTFGLVTRLS